MRPNFVSASLLTLLPLAALSPLAAGCSSTTAVTATTDASASGLDSSAPASDAAGADATDGASDDAGDAGAEGPQAFVGTWARGGTEVLTCPGGHVIEIPLGGDLVIAPGTAPGAIVATLPDGCTETYAVAKNVATAAPGQTCNASTEAGVHSVSTLVTQTLTVSGDGTTLAESSSATVVITATDGGVEDCSTTSSGSFTKQ